MPEDQSPRIEERILDLLRGGVRPLTAYGFVGLIGYGAVIGAVDWEVIVGLGGPVIGFYIRDRVKNGS